MNVTASKTMTRFPIVARANENLSNAYFRMRQGKCRHLPVVDSSGILVGIISDRDFQRAMWPSIILDMVDAHGLPETPTFKRGATVAEHMSWPAKTLSSGESLLTATRLMIEEKISAIVIVEDDQMIGILTHEDLLRVLANFLSEPESLGEKAMFLAYNSPLARVSNFLSGIGI